MKMLWFHLMPYTELPDDFKEKHPSVWVDIHSSLFDPRRAHHMYNDFLDELEYAAECGYDAICWASRMAWATSFIVLRLFIASCWILRNASASLSPCWSIR